MKGQGNIEMRSGGVGMKENERELVVVGLKGEVGFSPQHGA